MPETNKVLTDYISSKDIANFIKYWEKMESAAVQIAQENGWDDTFETPHEIGTAYNNIHSELSEAWDGYVKDKMDAHVPELQNEPVEISDAILRIMHLTGVRKLKIAYALVRKLEININRGHRHGGKKA